MPSSITAVCLAMSVLLAVLVRAENQPVSSPLSGLLSQRFSRSDRDFRPLQFGKRDSYRPLQFGKKDSYRPLQFGKRSGALPAVFPVYFATDDGF